jgi:amino acid transporter
MATAVVEERELLKTISWFDGFVVALANPSFLITGLGGSVISLGGWGAVILWTTSVIVGAFHNVIYSELAAMFPKLAGGIAIYAHEGWKRYLSFIGPLAAWGYWLGWSVVLSASGLVIGFLVQAEFYESSATSGFWNASNEIGPIPVYFSFPIALTIAVIVVIWLFNVLGMRPAVWVGYVTGGLLLIPLAVFMFLPYIVGDWSTSNLHNNIDWGNLTADDGVKLAIIWLYVMCWSSYGMECCATFAPEYRDTVNDTPKALRAAAVFGILVYALLPLGAIGQFGDQNLAADFSNVYSFYAETFDQIIGAGTGVAVILLCAGIALAMNTATADGSRALYGIAQDGMTIRQLGQLNRRHVPALAMTFDAIINILLLFTFASDASGALKILVFSNFGYVLAHVLALSGFLLLRKDRPGWPRPLRLGAWAMPLAALLLAFDTLLLVIGGWNAGLAYGTESHQPLIIGLIVLGLALLLYVFRVVVQDRKPLRLRLPAPATPEEELRLREQGVATSTV